MFGCVSNSMQEKTRKIFNVVVIAVIAYLLLCYANIIPSDYDAVERSIGTGFSNGNNNGTHRFIINDAIKQSGMPVVVVGTERTIKAPDGQDINWQTSIHKGETNHQILLNHIGDPDGFSLMGKWQEEHVAFPSNGLGYAPYMAQKYMNWAIETNESDLKYLYLAWSMHYLSDLGMPLHTVSDITMQTSHTEIEHYIDTQITEYQTHLTYVTIERQDVFDACWSLANYTTQYARPMVDGWNAGNYTIIDTISINVLSQTIEYVSMCLSDFETASVKEVSKPFSIFLTLAYVFAISVLTLLVLLVNYRAYHGWKPL